MIVRPWDRDKDYDTLVKWWSDWEFGTVPKECLPPLGIVVSEDGKDICAGGLWIYGMDSHRQTSGSKKSTRST